MFNQKLYEKQFRKLKHLYPAHAKRCLEILHLLNNGIRYNQLDGKYLRCIPNLIRFKLGNNYRLLVCKNGYIWRPKAILSHASYNHILKRRH